ncbi:hypothetical protein H920_03463 [Fukomys damarensis]|uniref:Uncharacterized protein n=1 Tax=Fukomys damarensis TaxID=885580 RepID=A0A091DXD5_FUKDA|nr:hypothetical protein H920_03463 [Fukomys damarensis]
MGCQEDRKAKAIRPSLAACCSQRWLRASVTPEAALGNHIHPSSDYQVHGTPDPSSFCVHSIERHSYGFADMWKNRKYSQENIFVTVGLSTLFKKSKIVDGVVPTTVSIEVRDTASLEPTNTTYLVIFVAAPSMPDSRFNSFPS